MSNLGARLQRIRKQRGLTQKGLAERINKSVSAISSYETNAQSPPLDVLISIAAALTVSLDYLTGFERKETIEIGQFTDKQNYVFQLLIKEFTSPSSDHGQLSANQTEILSTLLAIFYTN